MRTHAAGWLCAVALAAAGALPAAHAATASKSAAVSNVSSALWLQLRNAPADRSASGAPVEIKASKFQALTLDRGSLAAMLAAAPMEFTAEAKRAPLVISLPNPKGGFERFAVVESPVMEAGLAAKHPEIKTYSGRGIDDPGASLRLSISPQLGLNASVRSPGGAWFIDPLYHLDDSVYVSYYTRDAVSTRPAVFEPAESGVRVTPSRSLYRAGDTVVLSGGGFAKGAQLVVTVKNIELDALPRQTLYATAKADGSFSAQFDAEPYKTLGSYEVTVSDGRSSATTTYQVHAGQNPNATVGPVLKTYRLGLVTDPSYATYFGGSANVTAAKVALINRVTQIYEYETSIRMVLIAGSDLLNLDTAAQATGTNGPCGGAACFSSSQIASCGSGTLSRNTAVVGLIVGAGSYDIGHIALGVNGGGIAQLGVVGLAAKGAGCTGLPQPVGDFMAIDYVAHEMGHEYSANHSFNGVISNCSSGNRNAGTSVEPGSGSSVMAYAGICGTDNEQAHSDPYWSYRSFEEIVAHTSAAESTLNEVQTAGLRNYASATDTFQLRWNGADSVTIGTAGAQPYTAAGIKAAIEAIPGWPSGGTVTIGSVATTGFTITFSGALAGTDVPNLQLVNLTGSGSGFISDTTKGGTTTRRGYLQTDTGNSAPVVTVAGAQYTIPLQTPFALTGSATDADGDVVTYMWEQTDRGAAAGTGLISQPKANGPLFRQFGTAALVTSSGTLLYNSPGENHTDTNPTRVFPDLAQILANNTNAETGSCPTASSSPTQAQIDCFSEYLPTSAYTGFAGTNNEPSLNFRLTARDGKGGVGNATTKLLLAAGTGPFLVTSPTADGLTLNGGVRTHVTWNVAGTNAAPIGVANVKITMSKDGGLTYPHVLAESVPNTGDAVVLIPNQQIDAARIKVEAIGNVFFDVSNYNFAIRTTGTIGGGTIGN